MRPSHCRVSTDVKCLFSCVSGADVCASTLPSTLAASQELFSDSQDTVFSSASSFDEQGNSSTGDEVSRPISVYEPIHDQCMQRQPSPLSPPHLAQLDASKPPSRPPRALRPFKQDPASSSSSSSRKVPPPKRQYCYDPFVEYELPRCSLESTYSCSRADSFDLDPDIGNFVAREPKNDSIHCRQIVESQDNGALAGPPTWLTLDDVMATYDTTTWALDDVGIFQMPTCPLRREQGVSSLSLPYSPLAPTSSSIAKATVADDATDGRTRPRATSFMTGKALITSAIRKLSTTATTLTGVSSQDVSSRWTLRRTRSKLALTSELPCSTSVKHNADDSDEDSASEAFTPPQLSIATLPIVPSDIVPLPAISHLKLEISKAVKEEKAISSVVGSHNVREDTREARTSLPSYHRGLRKQLYPPRVRYEVSLASTKVPVRWQSSPIPSNPHFVSPMQQPSVTEPRAAFDGPRDLFL